MLEFIQNLGLLDLIFLMIIILWNLILKIITLYKSAERKQRLWFLLIALTFTFSILEVVYIIMSSPRKMKQKPLEIILKPVIKTQQLPKIKREKGYLYFVDKDGNIARVKRAKGRNDHKIRKPEVVLKTGLTKEEGFLYYIDKEGYVAKSKMVHGRKKKK